MQAQNANVSKTASIQKQFGCFKFACSVFSSTSQTTNTVTTKRKEKTDLATLLQSSKTKKDLHVAIQRPQIILLILFFLEFRVELNKMLK